MSRRAWGCGRVNRAGVEALERRVFLAADPAGASSGFVPPPSPVTADNPTQVVKVLVLDYDPVVPSEGNKKLHEVFNWSEPHSMADRYKAAMEYASGGAVRYQVVEWRDLDEFPAFEDGYRYTPEEYVQNRRTNTNWHPGSLDFYRLAREQNLAAMVNSGAIDEIWGFSDHYFLLFGEAWMAGPGSFFINGPSFPDVGFDRAVAGFGFSYERGLGEMIHNTGHRTENHMVRSFGGTWDGANPQTAWEKFAAVAKNTDDGVGGVGNTHYPVNGVSDYDYGNATAVPSTADDWLDYPSLDGATTMVSRDAWSAGANPDYQADYLKWFFGHLPRAAGTTADGRQNNWYKYIYDFNAYEPTTGRPRHESAVLGALRVDETGASSYTFTIRYYDQTGINASTLGSDDLQVTGPGGFSQLAQLVSVGNEVPTTAGTARTVTYRVTPPGGTWDLADNGTYSVAMRSGQVRDTAGNAVPAGSLGTFRVDLADPLPQDSVPPTATATSPDVTSVGGADQYITVDYADDRGVLVSSLHTGDVRVTGPNGFSRLATFYTVDDPTDGAARRATYYFIPPGGFWDSAENGTYTISLEPSQVSDTFGNTAVAGAIGTFTVNVPAAVRRPDSDLAENNASQYTAWAQDASASTYDDTVLTTAGAASVRFETDGGFDTYLRFPQTGAARWDLTEARNLYFDLYADDPSPFGFQEGPWVRLTDAAGNYADYHYYQGGNPAAPINDARGQWRSFLVPLGPTGSPSTGWRRTSHGTLDLTNVASLEIHADTWDFGFTMWVDRLGFDIPVHVVAPVLGASQVRLEFDQDVGRTLDKSDLQLLNVASGTAVAAADMDFAYDAGSRAATVTFPTLPGGKLPDGTYRLTLRKAGFTDAGGNRLAQDYVREFIAGVATTVVGRSLFYNRSAFDGNDAGVGTADDGAVATDKAPLLSGPASFANVSGYSRGINGVMVDVRGLPASTTTLDASDFEFKTSTDRSTWADAPAPSAIAVRRSSVPEDARVTLVWPDGAIANTWLRVTLKPGAHTGLIAPDVFSFGSLVGETGNSASALTVNAVDLGRVRAAQLTSNLPLTSLFDLNRDGRVNAVDLGIVRTNQLHTLPTAGAAPAAVTFTSVTTPKELRPKRVADGLLIQML